MATSLQSAVATLAALWLICSSCVLESHSAPTDDDFFFGDSPKLSKKNDADDKAFDSPFFGRGFRNPKWSKEEIDNSKLNKDQNETQKRDNPPLSKDENSWKMFKILQYITSLLQRKENGEDNFKDPLLNNDKEEINESVKRENKPISTNLKMNEPKMNSLVMDKDPNNSGNDEKWNMFKILQYAKSLQNTEEKGLENSKKKSPDNEKTEIKDSTKRERKPSSTNLKKNRPKLKSSVIDKSPNNSGQNRKFAFKNSYSINNIKYKDNYYYEDEFYDMDESDIGTEDYLSDDYNESDDNDNNGDVTNQGTLNQGREKSKVIKAPLKPVVFKKKPPNQTPVNQTVSEKFNNSEGKTTRSPENSKHYLNMDSSKTQKVTNSQGKPQRSKLISGEFIDNYMNDQDIPKTENNKINNTKLFPDKNEVDSSANTTQATMHNPVVETDSKASDHSQTSFPSRNLKRHNEMSKHVQNESEEEGKGEFPQISNDQTDRMNQKLKSENPLEKSLIPIDRSVPSRQEIGQPFETTPIKRIPSRLSPMSQISYQHPQISTESAKSTGYRINPDKSRKNQNFIFNQGQNEGSDSVGTAEFPQISIGDARELGQTVNNKAPLAEPFFSVGRPVLSAPKGEMKYEATPRRLILSRPSSQSQFPYQTGEEQYRGPETQNYGNKDFIYFRDPNTNTYKPNRVYSFLLPKRMESPLQDTNYYYNEPYGRINGPRNTFFQEPQPQFSDSLKNTYSDIHYDENQGIPSRFTLREKMPVNAPLVRKPAFFKYPLNLAQQERPFLNNPRNLFSTDNTPLPVKEITKGAPLTVEDIIYAESPNIYVPSGNSQIVPSLNEETSQNPTLSETQKKLNNPGLIPKDQLKRKIMTPRSENSDLESQKPENDPESLKQENNSELLAPESNSVSQNHEKDPVSQAPRNDSEPKEMKKNPESLTPKSDSESHQNPENDSALINPKNDPESKKPSNALDSQTPTIDSKSSRPKITSESLTPESDSASQNPEKDSVSKKPGKDAVLQRPEKDSVSQNPEKDAAFQMAKYNPGSLTPDTESEPKKLKNYPESLESKNTLKPLTSENDSKSQKPEKDSSSQMPQADSGHFMLPSKFFEVRSGARPKISEANKFDNPEEATAQNRCMTQQTQNDINDFEESPESETDCEESSMENDLEKEDTSSLDAKNNAAIPTSQNSAVGKSERGESQNIPVSEDPEELQEEYSSSSEDDDLDDYSYYIENDYEEEYEDSSELSNYLSETKSGKSTQLPENSASVNMNNSTESKSISKPLTIDSESQKPEEPLKEMPVNMNDSTKSQDLSKPPRADSESHKLEEPFNTILEYIYKVSNNPLFTSFKGQKTATNDPESPKSKNTSESHKSNSDSESKKPKNDPETLKSKNSVDPQTTETDSQSQKSQNDLA